MPSGDRIPSTYIWEDDMGTQHEVTQGEGCEQGDPLMPMLFCLGQYGALAADLSTWQGRILEEELRTKVGIRVHHGMEQVRPQGEWT